MDFLTDFQLIKSVLTIYGPLGLGWVVSLLLWRELVKDKRTIINIVEGNTKAITTIVEVVKRIEHKL